MNNVLTLDDVIKDNSKLVYYICSKYNNYPDKEDLYQVGKMALIDAYKNYDKNFNVKFSTYAYPYILGEVSKYVRENSNLKVSRDLIKLGKKINEYIEKHKKVRGYAPSIHDIALMLEVKDEKVLDALNASSKVKSLDDEIYSDGKALTLLDITPNKETIEHDVMLDLKEAFKYLSSEEKKLVIDRYYKDLTQSEVANLMGVNQVYVSRLEKKVLSKMKTMMKS
ncbi:MAG: sigma-70 family RNA polymerase sigma factor [Bacilli bacterium]|nr:sigma-70 family RNA polymerase sigma factor [Bacilli bacterium]